MQVFSVPHEQFKNNSINLYFLALPIFKNIGHNQVVLNNNNNNTNTIYL